jgi:sugar-specific transcriptional regulator TrmB
VYGLIAAQEHVPEVNKPHVQKLVEYGFVAFHPVRPDVPVALEPKQAVRRRAQAELEEAEARVALLRALPDLSDQMGELYDRGQWRAGSGSEFIDDVATVNARLDDVIASARIEILAAQPGGPRTQVQLNRSVERDQAALDRGVKLCTLYRATVRDTAVTAEYARTMTGKGASYRTLVGPFERAIIVDRRVAFISNHLVEGAPEHAAWQITDRAMVAYIAAEFEGKWRRADCWHGELRPRRQQPVDTVSSVDGVRTTRRQREILRDGVLGKNQRGTAKRLGISLRTLQGEINALKVLAGVSTLMELGFWWGTSPDRLVDDGPAVGETGAAA